MHILLAGDRPPSQRARERFRRHGMRRVRQGGEEIDEGLCERREGDRRARQVLDRLGERGRQDTETEKGIQVARRTLIAQSDKTATPWPHVAARRPPGTKHAACSGDAAGGGRGHRDLAPHHVDDAASDDLLQCEPRVVEHLMTCTQQAERRRCAFTLRLEEPFEPHACHGGVVGQLHDAEEMKRSRSVLVASPAGASTEDGAPDVGIAAAAGEPVAGSITPGGTAGTRMRLSGGVSATGAGRKSSCRECPVLMPNERRVSDGHVSLVRAKRRHIGLDSASLARSIVVRSPTLASHRTST